MLDLFGQLKDVVYLLLSAANKLSTLNKSTGRRKAVVDLLSTYFILDNVVRDGKSLLDSVGSDPVTKLVGLDPLRAQALVHEWTAVVKRQAARLHSLSGALLGQDALAVVDPWLKDHLQGIIGSKFDRADSLHGIGAGLVIYAMFGSADEREWLLDVIRTMYPEKAGDLLDVRKARDELTALEHALEEYRRVCERLATDEEIVAFAREARKRAK